VANERLSKICRLTRGVVGIGLFVFLTLGIQAGPPFVTDDPEPVDYQHFSDHQHLLFSAGRSIDGPTDFQAYIAWQFTFGPEFFHSISRSFRSGASAERRISPGN
jgi:hypothetical protein